jgi:hypothetical protein
MQMMKLEALKKLKLPVAGDVWNRGGVMIALRPGYDMRTRLCGYCRCAGYGAACARHACRKIQSFQHAAAKTRFAPD